MGAPSLSHGLSEHLGEATAFEGERGDASGGARRIQYDITVSGIAEDEANLTPVNL